MKAMILAAGMGSRIQATASSPKPLKKVGRHYLIEYHLYALSLAGVSDIVINLHFGEQAIRDALGNGARYGVNIEYIQEAVLLETGGGILNALPVLGVAPFIMISSDIWTDYSVSALLRRGSVEYAHCVMVDNPSYHRQGDYHLTSDGVLSCEGPSLTFGGLAVLNPKFFMGCKPGVFSLGGVMRQRIGQGMVSGEHFQGAHFNVGTANVLADLRGYITTVPTQS